MYEVEQSLRRSHCSRKGEEHKCVGTCKITPKGVELSCPVCGDDNDTNLPMYMSNPIVLNRAKRICSVIGIEFDNMTDTVQKSIVDEIYKDHCPGCYQLFMQHSSSYKQCSCGYTHSEYSGWEKPKENDKQNDTLVAFACRQL